jgi:hypothetical protein
MRVSVLGLMLVVALGARSVYIIQKVAALTVAQVGQSREFGKCEV